MNTTKKPLKIVLTGGGTAGHVMPHIALLPEMKNRQWSVFYIGSSGIEKTLIEAQKIPFYTIPTGKLRRYFSMQNVTDLFRILGGVVCAGMHLLKLKPDVVFSKGGFVSVPVSFAAKLLGIPVITHESDVTPGLANKLICPLATKIIHAFPETSRYLPASKAVLGGIPVRQELHKGSKATGLELCNFSADDPRPIVLCMGGSQGAKRLNEAIRDALPDLSKKFRIIHLTGTGKDLSISHEGYKGFEFVSDELKDLLCLADLVVGRAGANSIFELLELRKPMLLIPLVVGSRGDQVLNAKSFVNEGWALTLEEKNINSDSLLASLEQLLIQKNQLISAMNGKLSTQSVELTMNLLSGFQKP